MFSEDQLDYLSGWDLSEQLQDQIEESFDE